jgi:hypothetical protein
MESRILFKYVAGTALAANLPLNKNNICRWSVEFYLKMRQRWHRRQILNFIVGRFTAEYTNYLLLACRILFSKCCRDDNGKFVTAYIIIHFGIHSKFSACQYNFIIKCCRACRDSNVNGKYATSQWDWIYIQMVQGWMVLITIILIPSQFSVNYISNNFFFKLNGMMEKQLNCGYSTGVCNTYISCGIVFININ